MGNWTNLARVAGACAWFAAGSALAATQSLTILHDNDIHGHLRSFCYVEVAKGPDEHCDVGGAARRATLVRRLRAHSPAPTLLIDSGDTTTRGPLATQYEGVDEIAAMNAIGYDMAAIGNNEFKLKDAADIHDAAGAQAALARLVRGSRFPWLCANVTEADGSPLPGVRPYIVRRIGHLRVAFLGLTAPRSGSYPQTKGLVFTDPVKAANIWIPRARADADVVIAVTHIGVIDDRRLAAQTRGLDAIVGGDSHTYLYQLAEVKNLDGATVPVVQDGEFGVRLGKFDLTFEGDHAHGWRLTRYADDLIPVSADIRPDPVVAALVERYAHPLDVPVGSVPQIGASPAERASLTAQDLAQAWKAATGVEVGLQPEGDLFESFRTPTATRFQVHAILPFHDTLWRGQLTGARLALILSKPSALGGIMHATIALAAIDTTKSYTVATTDFVAAAMMPGGVDTGQDARVATEAWLRANPH
ncbi:MAG TPA: bifunctional UDP-sugar hydrolase/5'-nucleotidase [Caulobacteraceae bacterium]|jgi:2',3'-cyclic-nucleotide 2'-phosphodiesterase (5'-nucleotidase family)|nr:bifunctional UDP-sugar hydrolase/5'-nucleotidase [Caulobacteraceae bacterium]